MATPVRSRRVFGIGLWRLRFQFPPRLQDALLTCLTTVTDGAIYLIGPILICFALVIASGLSYTFFAVLLPMLKRAWSKSPSYMYYGILGLHIGYVIFILVNVLYNYFFCVVTPNKGKAYERVVRELADATGFQYPEFPDEVKQFKRDYEDLMILRMERRRARAAASNQPSNIHTAVPSGAASSDTVTQRRAGGAEASSAPAAEPPRPSLPKGGWRLMGPQEWGFCPYSNQPKPPRSHYDHVTKTLVLNMDHFCPWMFNTSTSICFLLHAPGIVISLTHSSLFSRLFQLSLLLQFPLVCLFRHVLWSVAVVPTLSRNNVISTKVRKCVGSSTSGRVGRCLWLHAVPLCGIGSGMFRRLSFISALVGSNDN
jgi:hypothetical protein